MTTRTMTTAGLLVSLLCGVALADMPVAEQIKRKEARLAQLEQQVAVLRAEIVALKATTQPDEPAAQGPKKDPPKEPLPKTTLVKLLARLPREGPEREQYLKDEMTNRLVEFGGVTKEIYSRSSGYYSLLLDKAPYRSDRMREVIVTVTIKGVPADKVSKIKMGKTVSLEGWIRGVYLKGAHHVGQVTPDRITIELRTDDHPAP